MLKLRGDQLIALALSKISKHSPFQTNWCIFCLRKCEVNNLENCDSDSHLKEIKRLQLFLKMLHRYIDSPELRFSFDDEDIHLQACQDCLILLQDFYDFYEEFRLLELKMNWKLEMLLAIMTSSEKVHFRKVEIRRFFHSKGKREKCTLRKLKQFRSDVIKKASEKVKSTFPVVKVKRCRQEKYQELPLKIGKLEFQNNSILDNKESIPIPTPSEILSNSNSKVEISDPFLCKRESVLGDTGEHGINEVAFGEDNETDDDRIDQEETSCNKHVDDLSCDSLEYIKGGSAAIHSNPIQDQNQSTKDGDSDFHKIAGEEITDIQSPSLQSGTLTVSPEEGERRDETGTDKVDAEAKDFYENSTDFQLVLSESISELSNVRSEEVDAEKAHSVNRQLSSLLKNVDDNETIRNNRESNEPIFHDDEKVEKKTEGLRRSKRNRANANCIDVVSTKITNPIKTNSEDPVAQTQVFHSKVTPPILQQLALKKLMSLKHVCNISPCRSKTFWNVDDLKRHLSHHGQFQCNFCDVVVNYAPDLWKHEFHFHKHTPKLKKGAKCPRCVNRYSSTSISISHFLTEHLNLPEDWNTCPICKVTLGRTFYLTSLPHLVSMHFASHHDYFRGKMTREGEMKRICDHGNCRAFFKTEKQLAAHKHSIHSTLLKLKPHHPPPPVVKDEYLTRKKSHRPWRKCLRCHKEFHTTRMLRNHVASRSCQKRGRAKSFLSLLKINGVTLSPEVESYFEEPLKVCKEAKCKKKFFNLKELEIHKKLHGKFKCSFCTKTFNYAEKLAFHEMRHASKPQDPENRNKVRKGLLCPRCPFSSIYKKVIVQHLLQFHLELEMDHHSCPACPSKFHSIVKFASFSQIHAPFRKHLAVAHDFSKTIYKCEKEGCKAYFNEIIQIRKHQRYHKLRLKYDEIENCRLWECMECEKSFKTKRRFVGHFNQYHGKDLVPYVQEEQGVHICHECGLTFKSKIGLHCHIHFRHKKRSDLKPARERMTYICEMCGKSFADSHKLALHGYSHTGPESWKFTCETCNKRCMTKQKLEEHMRTHTKEKLFACEHCGISYAHRHNLRNHINSKHSDITTIVPRKFDKSRLPSKKGITLKNSEEKSKSTKPRRRIKRKRVSSSSSALTSSDSDSE